MNYVINKFNIEKDKDFILDCHCKINFKCASDWEVVNGFEAFSDKWFSTNQPREFLDALIYSLKDERTLAIVIKDGLENIGYAWVRFFDIQDYDMTIAEIDDTMVIEKYQNKGIATYLMDYITEKSKLHGATILRSATGISNLASIGLHEKLGFKSYRVEFEKIL